MDIISILGGDWLLEILYPDESTMTISDQDSISEWPTSPASTALVSASASDHDHEADHLSSCSDIELDNSIQTYLKADSIDHIIDTIYRKFMTEITQRGITVNIDNIPMLKCYAGHSNLDTYFDQIYVLNLDRRIDRWDRMKILLEKNHITNYRRFSGVDAKDPEINAQWEVYRKHPPPEVSRRNKGKRKGIPSAGSLAILIGMRKMLEDAIRYQHRRILVLQDDLIFHKQFENEFMKMNNYVPVDWKLLYLGASQHNWGPEVKFSTRKNIYYPSGTADGAFAVGIDQSVYHDLIREIDRIELPFDSGALCEIQRRYPYQCPVLFPNLIIADVRDSDLRNARNLHGIGDKFRWNLNLYDVI